MNRINYLSVLGFVTFISLSLFSCSQDDDLISSSLPKTRTVQLCTTRAEANLILVNYLELVNGKYVLNISKDKAEELGVPISLYEGALSEIAITNEFVEKIKKDPTREIELTDPQKALKEHSVLVQLTKPSVLIGDLATTGQQETMSRFIWAPYGTRLVRFLCRANAAILPMFRCRTYSSGGWISKSAVGLIGKNTVIQVPLYVSNDYVRVAFSVTDSKGGMTTYRGY